MAGNLTNFLVHELLDHAFRNAAYTPPATVFLGLSTTLPTDAGGNFTEVSTVGTAYVRQAVTFGAASGRQVLNGAITFPIATASWGTVVAWGIFDQVSGGNLLAYGECLDAPFFFEVVPASDLVSTGNDGAHGLIDGQRVQVEAETGSLPTPLVDNVTYFVRDSTTFTLKLAATLGGAAIDITSNGSGTLWIAGEYKLLVSIGDRYQIAANDLIVRVRALLAK